jgi:radical SAM-linked protein
MTEMEERGKRGEIEVTSHESQVTEIEKNDGRGILRHDTEGQAIEEGSERRKEDMDNKEQDEKAKREAGKRFTFRYIKRSDARYIGHIDTMNIILRALRASGIEIIMHRKYHPMPKIVLSDALPIGIESTCELIEIEAVQGTVIDNEMLKMINRGMPRGMKMKEFIEGSLKDMVKEYLYVLVSETDVGDEFEQWKRKGRKYFYIWKDSRVKSVWMRGVFQRIIKIEANKIYGV